MPAPHFVSLERLCELAHAGEAICFPTDTVPALAALPRQAQVVYELKRRSRDKPLAILAANTESLQSYVLGWETAWSRLAGRGWPGALTLVLPASAQVPADAIARGSTVGVRVPDLAMARQLLARTGPLVASSVNLSGQAPLLNPVDIAAVFPQLPILQAEFPSARPPSTVMKWQSGHWKMVRQGAFVGPFQ
ncbi:MAG: L-threonylcarbamoyladenylate synthase [Cyanobacteria bacterium J06642_2]